jgi:hypothetical protein
MNEEERKVFLEESKRKYEEDKIASKKAIFDLIEHNEMLDEDGYPTDACLDVIELWHWSDPKGWFEFIKGCWHLSSWGWNEVDEPHEWASWDNQYKDKIVHKYHISTAGWSGNESIIRSMQKNNMMWYLNWEQSRRGGHYIFELRELDDE